MQALRALFAAVFLTAFIAPNVAVAGQTNNFYGEVVHVSTENVKVYDPKAHLTIRLHRNAEVRPNLLGRRQGHVSNERSQGRAVRPRRVRSKGTRHPSCRQNLHPQQRQQKEAHALRARASVQEGCRPNRGLHPFLCAGVFLQAAPHEVVLRYDRADDGRFGQRANGARMRGGVEEDPRTESPVRPARDGTPLCRARDGMRIPGRTDHHRFRRSKSSCARAIVPAVPPAPRAPQSAASRRSKALLKMLQPSSTFVAGSPV